MIKQLLYKALSIALFLGLFAPLAVAQQKNKKVDSSVEKKVEATLKKMTQEEKFQLIGEYTDGFSIRPMPKYGIPQIKMSDASIGIRNYGPSTQYPASIVAASTWNVRYVYGEGTALAADAKNRGVKMVLGPGVNIMRAPVCGRNFEYYSEDPYLTSMMGVNFINGLQSQGVGATVKHFALNNMEWGRQTIDSRADERTMHEIYFPAFKAAVEDANVAAVMDSYNLINGAYATENSWLNLVTLRKQWGFNGILMSDWGATHHTAQAVIAGLDLDMDGGKQARYFNVDSLKKALDNGEILMSTIDTKVKNILRVIYRFGWDKQEDDSEAKLLDRPESNDIALAVAQEGIVLLKNDKNLLPLDKKKLKKIMVFGDLANQNVRGGGSSAVTPMHFTTLDQSLKATFPNTKFVVHEDVHLDPCRDLYLERGGGKKGLKVEYFHNSTLGGTPLYSETVENINFNWGENSSPNEDILGNENFSMRFTGYLRVEKAGDYDLALISESASRMWIDGALVIDNWGDHEANVETYPVSLEANHDYEVKIEYAKIANKASVKLAYYEENQQTETDDASTCDAVVIAAGFGEAIEKEGSDRPWQLPADQVALINEISAKNKHTIVVLYTGGAVDVSSWIGKVQAVIWAGYPGQDGGKALAQIISGEVNPSGHLTSTWAKRWEDYPCANNFYEKEGEEHLDYKEGLLVGYRGFDANGVEPVFPFGYGMSYTKYSYGKLSAKKKGKRYEVKVDVKNTGKMDGSAVVQVYVEPKNHVDGDPIRTLRAFDKIKLKAGEKKTVTLYLDESAFSTYKPDKHKFTLNPGEYVIKVGEDSRHLDQKANLKIDKPVVME